MTTRSISAFLVILSIVSIAGIFSISPDQAQAQPALGITPTAEPPTATPEPPTATPEPPTPTSEPPTPTTEPTVEPTSPATKKPPSEPQPTPTPTSTPEPPVTLPVAGHKQLLHPTLLLLGGLLLTGCSLLLSHAQQKKRGG